MSLTPSIVLCKLYERQARKRGQTYFAGIQEAHELGISTAFSQQSAGR